VLMRARLDVLVDVRRLESGRLHPRRAGSHSGCLV